MFMPPKCNEVFPYFFPADSKIEEVVNTFMLTEKDFHSIGVMWKGPVLPEDAPLWYL
jgi:hypothetical protein